MLIIFGQLAVQPLLAQNIVHLFSPDNSIQLNIKTSDFLEIELLVDSIVVLDYSRLSLSIEDKEVLGLNMKVRKKQEKKAVVTT